MNGPSMDEDEIMLRESVLRAWFTEGLDAITAQIDGLDIGWGGVQRWATLNMPRVEGLHLDFACGYATFLAQLGWRFAKARLVGLNIDFAGPHAGARPLLEKAGVETMLVEADARKMPFDEGTFDSASCFLGLQDIKIGFGSEGVRQSVCEALRVLRPGGTLVLIDKYAYRQYDLWFSGLPAEIIDRRKRRLDVCWNREVAMAAIKLLPEDGSPRCACLPQTKKTKRQPTGKSCAEWNRRLNHN